VSAIVAISSLVVDVVVKVDVINVFEAVVVYATLIDILIVFAYVVRVCDVEFL